MKHAILIMTYSEPHLIELNIQNLDSKNVDFYIHVDKKSNLEDFSYLEQVAKYSKVNIYNPYKVYWGGHNQIKTEMFLFKKAFEEKYDYYHLISGQDMCIKNKQQFEEYFEELYPKNYLKIEKKATGQLLDRVRFYHPMSQNSLSRTKVSSLIGKILVLFQKIVKVNRNKNTNFYFGENWCSLTNDFVKILVDHYENGYISKRFFKSSSADELYKQTIFMEFANSSLLTDKKLRYIDWSQKKASPKTLDSSDFNSIISSEAIFARKFTDKNLLPEEVMEYIIKESN